MTSDDVARLTDRSIAKCSVCGRITRVCCDAGMPSDESHTGWSKAFCFGCCPNHPEQKLAAAIEQAGDMQLMANEQEQRAIKAEKQLAEAQATITALSQEKETLHTLLYGGPMQVGAYTQIQVEMMARDENLQRAERAELTLAKLSADLRVTEQLLAERQRVLDAIPLCAQHGSCVPHALEWIADRSDKRKEKCR